MDLTFCLLIKLWMLICYCIYAPTDAQQSATTTQQTCGDIESNCPDYGHNAFCNETTWAETNCRRSCGFCNDQSAAQHNATTTQQPCEDIDTNCTEYGRSYLCSTYGDWTMENCNSYCGLCDAPPAAQQSATPTGQTCVDSPDCSEYEKSSLCASEYGMNNCSSYCGFCECVDTYTNCTVYAATISNFCLGEYRDWASLNCARFCGFCTNAVATSASVISDAASPNPTECVDLELDCNAYDPAACTYSQHLKWALTSCRKTCNKCQEAGASPIVTAASSVTDATTQSSGTTTIGATTDRATTGIS